MRPLPSTMKSPQDKRPVWRGGILQVWTTRACDQACFGCTQGSNLAGKPGMISPEQYEQALKSLECYWGIVGMFGGNPAMHPQFEELCRIERGLIPWEQRGVWCNHPRGKGATMRITFNPAYSNLNVHLDRSAFDEFCRDWPECRYKLLGIDPAWPEARDFSADHIGDSRHSPVYVAMQDIIPDEDERWRLIGRCDVNQLWSAMICVFRGQLRGYFCEIAASQAMLHQHEPDYPDLGVPIEPGWWDQGMDAFDEQARFHCHACGFPMRGYGDLAVGGTTEQVSATHAAIYKPKTRGRPVQLVSLRSDVREDALGKGTNYVQNGAL
jgi:hypothetical protein